ncbi:preprotein translocase [Nocardioides sp. Soil797]|nr:preprotein translocase [Nocardioides sp. Soil797]
MFGLTFEKLFLVALIAGVVIGPSRLPHCAHRLGEVLRSLRGLVDSTRRDAEREMGVTLTRAEWEALDPRQFDPRRIMRRAINEQPLQQPAEHDALLEEASRVRPGQRHLVNGSAAHPRRIPIASLALDDPRRMAAEPVDQPVHPRSSVDRE